MLIDETTVVILACSSMLRSTLVIVANSLARLSISSGVGDVVGSDQIARRSPAIPNQDGMPDGGLFRGTLNGAPRGSARPARGPRPRGSFFGYLITLPVGTETAMIAYY